ncbi:MAG TPA: hypothetical protein VJH20_04830 [Candidatus Nanoarchaeia archaeon]|nr:hypothetical protein [Candidatus Nanoarchaeia archaeon]
MERKLIKQGKGGLTIYLPKKWLQRKNLSEGDNVKITEKGFSLVISSELSEKKEIEIDLDKNNRGDIINLLTHIYRRGFDKIKIINVDNETMKKIKETISELLLGFEIIEKSSNFCVVENISEPTEEKYEAMLKRIFFILKETHKELLISAENNKFNNLSEIKEMRHHQDKLVLFCRRLISKEKISNNPITNWELLTFLTHIQHTYFYLYQFASKNKVKISKETLNLIEYLGEYLDLFYKSMYERKLEYVHEINLLKDSIQSKCFQRMSKSKGNETVVLSFIRELFRKIQIGTSPILVDLIEEEVIKDN